MNRIIRSMRSPNLVSPSAAPPPSGRLRPSEPVIGPAEGGTRWTGYGGEPGVHTSQMVVTDSRRAASRRPGTTCIRSNTPTTLSQLSFDGQRFAAIGSRGEEQDRMPGFDILRRETMRVFCGMLIVAAAMAVAPAAMAQAPAGGTAHVVTYIEVVPSAQSETAGPPKT